MNSPLEETAPGHGDTAKGAVETRPPRELGDLHKTITMAQIAKAANVSQGAISSLLNDRDYGIRVSEKTRERVFKVCREMGYIPNDLRAVVRMYPELGEFCLLVAETVEGGLGDPLVARLAQGVMAAMSDPSRPLTIALYNPTRDYTGHADDLPHPVRSGIASKFLFYGPLNGSLVAQIQRRGLPIISLGGDAQLPGSVSFVPDYAAASRLAIEHLFALGHERIAIISGPFGTSDTPTIELHRGIKAVFDERRLPIEAQNIVYGDLTFKAGAATLERLLEQGQRPTAIFCLSDAAAAGVVSQARLQGKRVPEDFSVVGCCDDPCSQFILPALTTVRIPAEEMAQKAVKLLERLVREPLPADAQRVLLPVELIERQSTARAPKT